MKSKYNLNDIIDFVLWPSCVCHQGEVVIYHLSEHLVQYCYGVKVLSNNFPQSSLVRIKKDDLDELVKKYFIVYMDTFYLNKEIYTWILEPDIALATNIKKNNEIIYL